MGSLLLLGTLGLIAGLLIAIPVQLIGAKWRSAGMLALLAGGIVVGYFLVLLGVSAGSRERVVPVGTRKKFCAADCDLAMLVDSVERSGQRYVVRVRVLSSAARVTMKPSDPEVLMLDESGREYRGSDELDPFPLARRVGPGESYVKTLVFRVPPDVRDPRVYLSEGGWVTRFVIGDENSFWHKKTLVRMNSN